MQQVGSAIIREDEIHIESLLGQGQYGKVWKGKCRSIDVAIKKPSKQLSAAVIEEFRHEVQIMSEIQHPNICLFLGACFKPGAILVVSELMEGSVAKLIKEPPGKYSTSTRLRWGLETAKGMSWLHGLNPPIIHMDLKLDNILYDSELRIKVCDFGLSRWSYDSINMPIGTPLYMAPEMLDLASKRTRKAVDPKFDVYSFGIVLWEILSCKEAFSHHNELNTFRRAICSGERPPIPSDCLPSLKKLLEQCWTHRPEDRPLFPEIVQALEIIVQEYTLIERDNLVKKYTSDPGTIQFWNRHFGGQESVNFREFIVKLWNDFGLPVPRDLESTLVTDRSDYIVQNVEVTPENIPVLCLKALCAESDGTITVEKFGKISGWLGPLEFPSPENGFLKRLVNLMENKAFHGLMDGTAAESELRRYGRDSYLIRFSPRNLCSYCVSVYKTQENKVFHLVIAYQNGQFCFQNHKLSSLQALISDVIEPNVRHFCPSEKFAWIFDAHRAAARNAYIYVGP